MNKKNDAILRKNADDRTARQLRNMLSACIQCGTCTASCPNAFAMDISPRRIWRLILLDRLETVFNSHTFRLCSFCYTCTLRCPRGLLLTEAMILLKQAASSRGMEADPAATRFYKSFIKNIEHHDRLKETRLMIRFFWESRNPMLPFRFTPLGIRLMIKGKLTHRSGSTTDTDGIRLQSIFRKIREKGEPI